MAGVGSDDAATRALVLGAIRSGEHPALAGIGDPEIEWVGVNGARVDAALRSDDGGVWHVVLQVAEPGEVSDAVAFRRPATPVAQEGVLVVANGPSGSGKSSLITALAEIDPARAWVVFDEPVLGRVAPPFLIWPDASPALHDGFLAGICAVARAGNVVATAAAGHPQRRFAAAADGVRTLYVGLHCPVAELLRREQGRDGRWGGLAEQSLGAHDGWTYDLELDSTAAPPVELARQVLALVGAAG